MKVSSQLIAIFILLFDINKVVECIGISDFWRIFSPAPAPIPKTEVTTERRRFTTKEVRTVAHNYEGVRNHPTESYFYPTTPGDAAAFEKWEQEQEEKYAKEILQSLASPNDTELQYKAKTLIANFLVHVAVDNVTGHGHTHTETLTELHPSSTTIQPIITVKRDGSIILRQDFPELSSHSGFGIISPGALALQFLDIESWPESSNNDTEILTTTTTTTTIPTTTTTTSATTLDAVQTESLDEDLLLESILEGISNGDYNEEIEKATSTPQQDKNRTLLRQGFLRPPSDLEFEVPQSAGNNAQIPQETIKPAKILDLEDIRGQIDQQGNLEVVDHQQNQQHQHQPFVQPGPLESEQNQPFAPVEYEHHVDTSQNVPGQNHVDSSQNAQNVQSIEMIELENTRSKYEDLLQAALEQQYPEEIANQKPDQNKVYEIKPDHPNYPELLKAALQLQQQQQLAHLQQQQQQQLAQAQAEQQQKLAQQQYQDLQRQQLEHAIQQQLHSQNQLQVVQVSGPRQPKPKPQPTQNVDAKVTSTSTTNAPGGFNPLQSIFSVLPIGGGGGGAEDSESGPLAAILNRFGPGKGSTEKPETTTSGGSSVNQVELMSQVGRLRENVEKRNISGVLDESLKIASVQTIGVLVTGFLDLVLCNPVDRWKGNCNQKPPTL